MTFRNRVIRDRQQVESHRHKRRRRLSRLLARTPRFESLESRKLLAVAAFNSDTGLLTVKDEPMGEFSQFEDNAFKIERINDGQALQVTDHGIVIPISVGDDSKLSIPFVDVNEIDVQAAGGDDSLTVDMNGGNPVPSLGLGYRGGSQSAMGRDLLAVVGDGTSTGVYTPDGTETGSGVVAVNDGSGATEIRFSELEPVDLLNFATVTISLPNDDDELDIDEGLTFLGGLDAMIVSGSSGGVPIETVALRNNGHVIIDTTFDDGDDAIDINETNNLHGNSDLSILTGVGTDTPDVVWLKGDFDLDGAPGSEDLLIRTEQINLGEGTDIDSIDVNRDVALIASGGSISRTSPYQIFAGRDVVLAAYGNVELDYVSSQAGDVYVAADTDDDGDGAIVDKTTFNSINIAANGANLKAGSGIGDGVASDDNDIRLIVDTVAAETDSGDVNLANFDSLSIGSFDDKFVSLPPTAASPLPGLFQVEGLNGILIADDPLVGTDTENSGGDDITVRVAYGVSETVTLKVENNAPVLNQDGGDITLAAETTDLETRKIYSDLEINDDVAITDLPANMGTPGNIWLYASRNVMTGSTANISAVGSGNVFAAAGIDFSGGAENNGQADGLIEMDDDSKISSQTGHVVMLAPGDITITQIETDGRVALVADYAGIDPMEDLSDGKGAIMDGLDSELTNIGAADVLLQAGSGIGGGVASDPDDLDLQVALVAALTDSGDVNLENVGALTIGTVGELTVNLAPDYNNSEPDSVTVGPLSGITIVDDPDLGMDDQDSGQDDITVRARSPLTVDAPVINNDGGDITLAAEGKEITDNLTINADVKVTVDNVNTPSNGSIWLYAGNDLLISGDTTISVVDEGNVFAAAGTDFNGGDEQNGYPNGSVSMADNTAISSEDGNIVILATGDITLSKLETTDRVAVIADYQGFDSSSSSSDGVGRILDGLTSSETFNIKATQVLLQAGSGVGEGVASDPRDIDLEVDLVAAQTDSGDVNLQNLGGLVIGTFAELTVDLAPDEVDNMDPLTVTVGPLSGITIVDSANENNGKAITVRTGDPSMAVSLTVENNAPVLNHDGGNITLAAEGASDGDDLIIKDDVQVSDGDGNIWLYAGADIETDSEAMIAVTGAGNVLVTAGTNFNGGSEQNGFAPSNVTMGDGAIIGSGTGNVVILAPEDITLSQVQTGGRVAVVADYAGIDPMEDLSDGKGAIIDGLGTELTNIAAGEALLQAGNGIGDGVAEDPADLDLQVSLVAAETDSGDVNLENVGALTIGTFNQLTVALAPDYNNSAPNSVTVGPLSGITILDDPMIGMDDQDSGQDVITVRTIRDVSATDNSLLVAGNVTNRDAGNIHLRAVDSADRAANLTVSDGFTVAILLDPMSMASGGDILLQAGDNVSIEVGSTVNSAGEAGTITIKGDLEVPDPDVSSGSTIDVNGTLIAANHVSVLSGDDNDVVNLAPTADPAGTRILNTLDGISRGPFGGQAEINVDPGGNEPDVKRQVTTNATAGFETELTAELLEGALQVMIPPEFAAMIPSPDLDFQIHVNRTELDSMGNEVDLPGEDMLVTQVDGGTLTVERAQNGTDAMYFPAGSKVTIEIFTRVADGVCLAADGYRTMNQEREVGDLLNVDDSGTSDAEQYVLNNVSLVRTGGPVINYQNVEELVTLAGGDSPNAQVNLPASEPQLPLVGFSGGGGGGIFDVNSPATPDAQINHNIIIGDPSTDATVRSLFEIQNFDHIEAKGSETIDDIVNLTSIESLIEGVEGNDILVGGLGVDVIAAGGGADFLDATAGADFLLADIDLAMPGDPIVDPPGRGDFIDAALDPGVTVFQIGENDVVANLTGILYDGGACKNVITWLRARLPSNGGGATWLSASAEESVQRGLEALGIVAPLPDPPPVPDSPVPPDDSTDPDNSTVPETESDPTVEKQVVYDVNSDGRVTALDALRVINVMSRQDQSVAGELVGTSDSVSIDNVRDTADVNADGRVTGLDALLIINELKRQTVSEGESGPLASIADAVTSEDSRVAQGPTAVEDAILLVDNETLASQSWADSVDQALNEILVDDQADEEDTEEQSQSLSLLSES